MAVSCIYTTTVTLSEPLHEYLIVATDHERSFENALSTAIGENVGSGTNTYTEHEEWAEYVTWEEAKQAETRMQSVVKEFEAKAVEYFHNHPTD